MLLLEARIRAHLEGAPQMGLRAPPTARLTVFTEAVRRARRPRHRLGTTSASRPASVSCVVRRMISVLSTACAFGHRPPMVATSGTLLLDPLDPLVRVALCRQLAHLVGMRPQLPGDGRCSSSPLAAISTIRDRSRSRTVALLDRDHRLQNLPVPLPASSILTAFRMWLPLDCSGSPSPARSRNHNPNHR